MLLLKLFGLKFIVIRDQDHLVRERAQEVATRLPFDVAMDGKGEKTIAYRAFLAGYRFAGWTIPPRADQHVVNYGKFLERMDRRKARRLAELGFQPDAKVSPAQIAMQVGK